MLHTQGYESQLCDYYSQLLINKPIWCTASQFSGGSCIQGLRYSSWPAMLIFVSASLVPVPLFRGFIMGPYRGALHWQWDTSSHLCWSTWLLSSAIPWWENGILGNWHHLLPLVCSVTHSTWTEVWLFLFIWLFCPNWPLPKCTYVATGVEKHIHQREEKIPMSGNRLFHTTHCSQPSTYALFAVSLRIF